MRNRKKGFTLVELAVAMAITALLALTMARILPPVYKTYHRTAERSDAQMIAGNIVDVLRSAIEKAETVTVTTLSAASSITVDGEAYAVSDDGYLKCGEDDVFAPAYYEGKTISLQANLVPGRLNAADVTVTVLNGGEELASITATLSTLKSQLDSAQNEVNATNMLTALEQAVSVNTRGNVNLTSVEARIAVITETFGSGFPVYVLDRVDGGLSTKAAEWRAYYSETIHEGGNGGPNTSYFNTLATGTLYLGAYVAQPPTAQMPPLQTPLTVAYLTDSPATNAPANSSVYLLYHQGTWYIRNTPLNTDGLSGTALNTLDQLDGKTAAEYMAYLTDPAGYWMPVRELHDPPTGP